MQTADVSSGSAGTWNTLGSMSVTLNVLANSRIHVSFSACIMADNNAFHGFLRVAVDGVGLAGTNVKQAIGNNPGTGVAIEAVTGQLSAGNHTVTIEWATNLDTSTNTVLRCNAATTPLRHHACIVAQEWPA